MSVQVCPHHERLQNELNGLEQAVASLREWKAAEEVRYKSVEEKLDRTLRWMQWAVGLSASTALGLLGMLAALLLGK